MGLLLSVGLVAIVVSTLLLLPALVQLVPGLHSAHRATPSAAPGREFPL
jgi:predicted RND superfamily exporter protein